MQDMDAERVWSRQCLVGWQDVGPVQGVGLNWACDPSGPSTCLGFSFSVCKVELRAEMRIQ